VAQTGAGLAVCPKCGAKMRPKYMAKHKGSQRCAMERKYPTRTRYSVWAVGGGLPDSNRSRH